VSTPSSETIAKQMAGNPPVVSELRFRRLIQRDRNDLYPAMIRAIRMLGKQVNIYDLAASTYYWGDQVKRRWAFDYFPNTPEKQSA
jgi:CRISPR system Cascade subunit CasB